MYNSVYVVGVVIEGDHFMVGTGFACELDSSLWTNAHVAEVLLEVRQEHGAAWFAAKAGTVTGSSSHTIQDIVIHPDYDTDTFNSPDIAFLELDRSLDYPIAPLLPRDMYDSLRIGQPLGTLGFPGPLGLFNGELALASFKGGTLSSLRPV